MSPHPRRPHHQETAGPVALLLLPRRPAEGADLGEMNKVLMEKVEELTLYIIDLQKQINELKSNR